MLCNNLDEGRLKLLDINLKEVRVGEDVNLRLIARRLDGYEKQIASYLKYYIII